MKFLILLPVGGQSVLSVFTFKVTGGAVSLLIEWVMVGRRGTGPWVTSVPHVSVVGTHGWKLCTVGPELVKDLSSWSGKHARKGGKEKVVLQTDNVGDCVLPCRIRKIYVVSFTWRKNPMSFYFRVVVLREENCCT